MQKTTEMTEALKGIASLILEKDNILILTHANPDGDTLGCACSLCLALRSMGKTIDYINGDEISSEYRIITERVSHIDFEPDFIMSVDVADVSLLVKEVREKYAGRISLAIDHHRLNRIAAERVYIENDSASCCEIVFLLLKEMRVDITPEIADCLFFGISTDTGCFRYSNVTARTHGIASELISCGANAGKINEIMFETKSFARLKLQQRCLEGLELYFDGRLSIFTISLEIVRETGAQESDFDTIVSLSRQIEGVKMGITLKEKPGGIVKVSVRTGEEYNAAEFCSRFGGGGHIRAGGCSFTGDPEEVKAKLLPAAEELFFGENAG